jgi:hypothetical protein
MTTPSPERVEAAARALHERLGNSDPHSCYMLDGILRSWPFEECPSKHAHFDTATAALAAADAVDEVRVAARGR